MVLPETDAAAAKIIAERTRQAIIDLNIPHQFSKAADRVSVSIGLATIRIDDRIEPQTFLETADQNLYQAKLSGRNQVIGSELGR
jgi:diguanylate cyclase (GGDEF)-like protein